MPELTLPVEVEVSRDSGRALYRQIAEQIKTRISDGRLPQGSRLPTVRQMAENLNVSPLTVYNAYNDLQAEGLVESLVGCGTFVTGSANASGLASSLWQLASPNDGMIDMHRVIFTSGLRTMAIAAPDPALFQEHEFWASLGRLRKQPASQFWYGQVMGDVTLTNEISELLKHRGVLAPSPEILVTLGSSQALAMTILALTKPGDTVAVESPTYVGFLSALQTFGVKPVFVPMDDEGPDLDALAYTILREKPRFFFTMPNFHNCTGRKMSIPRRHELLSLTAKYGIPIVEDDIAGRLSFDSDVPQPLKALDQSGQVILIDSFSKTLYPGLRLGYVVAPPAIRESLVTLMRAMLLHGQPFVQRALANFIREGLYDTHVRRVLPRYRERRDVLLSALEQHMPEGVTWSIPQGGFSSWITLPERGDFSDLAEAALHRGVAFAPGKFFIADPQNDRHLRLSYGCLTSEAISESVLVLGELVKQRMV